MVNSWNLQRLTINGVDFTNRWVGSGSYPPQINGFGVNLQNCPEGALSIER